MGMVVSTKRNVIHPVTGNVGIFWDSKGEKHLFLSPGTEAMGWDNSLDI